VTFKLQKLSVRTVFKSPSEGPNEAFEEFFYERRLNTH
jgi:hypothetical protein